MSVRILFFLLSVSNNPIETLVVSGSCPSRERVERFVAVEEVDGMSTYGILKEICIVPFVMLSRVLFCRGLLREQH
jgi:hypothetical protein